MQTLSLPVQAGESGFEWVAIAKGGGKAL